MCNFTKQDFQEYVYCITAEMPIISFQLTVIWLSLKHIVFFRLAPRIYIIDNHHLQIIKDLFLISNASISWESTFSIGLYYNFRVISAWEKKCFTWGKIQNAIIWKKIALPSASKWPSHLSKFYQPVLSQVASLQSLHAAKMSPMPQV